MSIDASQPMIYRKVIWKLSEQLTGIGGGGGREITNQWTLARPERTSYHGERITMGGFQEFSLAAFLDLSVLAVF